MRGKTPPLTSHPDAQRIERILPFLLFTITLSVVFPFLSRISASKYPSRSTTLPTVTPSLEK